MHKTITKEEATKWLENNAPRIKLLEWKCNGNKSKFIDTNRSVEFEYRFTAMKTKLKKDPRVLFGASKEEVQEKRKQTNIEKYGVESPAQNKYIQEKIKQTNLEKYGVEHPFQNKEIQEKIKQTNIKKYGTERPAQNKEIQEKIKRTNIERFGVKCSLQNKEVQEKIKQTNLKKYGVENPFQSKEVQEKIKQANLEKYGVEYSSQSKEVQERIKKTSLEKYGVERPAQNREIQEKIRQTNIKKRNTVIVNGKTLKEVATEKGCGYTTLQQLHKKFGEDAVENYEKKQYQSQEYVAGIVRKILPNQEVFVEHSTPWKTAKGGTQRFDISIPRLNLAIEYHGEQHFEPIEYFGGEKIFKEIQRRDSYKREMCTKNRIRLIEIKYYELKYDESDIEMIRDKIDQT